MINSILLRQLRNSEFIRFQKHVVTVCEAANPTALKIAPQVAALKTALTPLDELFVKERGNVITSELEALDARRDAALVGIRLQAESFTYHYDSAIKKDGEQVLAAIDKYGKNLARLNYLAETEVIESIYADFTTDAQLNTALQTLELEDWLEELTNANKLFNTRYLARNTEYAQRPDGNMQGQRDAAIAAYQELSNHIVSHNTITPADSYKNLIAEINSLVAQYNQLLSNRAGGRDEEDDELPGDDDATPRQL